MKTRRSVFLESMPPLSCGQAIIHKLWWSLWCPRSCHECAWAVLPTPSQGMLWELQPRVPLTAPPLSPALGPRALRHTRNRPEGWSWNGPLWFPSSFNHRRVWIGSVFNVPSSPCRVEGTPPTKPAPSNPALNTSRDGKSTASPWDLFQRLTPSQRGISSQSPAQPCSSLTPPLEAAPPPRSVPPRCVPLRSP